MADNLRLPDSHPLPASNTTIPFSSPGSVSVAPPPGQPTSTLHYPHMYVDPLAAAAASAFYQQQQQRQQPLQVSQCQPVSSQIPPSHTSNGTQQPQGSSQAIQNPQAAQAQQYYLHDPAMAAVALQQMQLQMQIQLQAHQQQQRPATTTQTPHMPDQTTHRANVDPTQRTSTATHPSANNVGPNIPLQHPAPPVPTPIPAPIPPSMLANAHSLQNPNAAMNMPARMAHIPARMAHIPVVPASQMASAYRIGRYTPAERRIRLERYREKRSQRNYSRRVKYDCRKMIADKRRRVQGRFVKREEEMALAAQQQGKSIGGLDGMQKIDEGGDGTDGTEDETKVHHHLDSTGSGSSTQPLEAVAINGRIVDMDNECVPTDASGISVSFSEQSDQVLHQFR